MSSKIVPEACARFLSSVTELVTNPAAAAEHEAHRSGCASCADELALAQRIQMELASMPELDPPEAMWTSLQTRLDEADAEPARTRQRAPRLVPRLVRSPARS